MTAQRRGRRIFNTSDLPFQDYDLEGQRQPEISWLPLSYDSLGGGGQGSYLMRMAPGAETIAHDHPGFEEFMVLEGSLTDDDGVRYGPGDHVCYEPGTRHNSRSEDGCLLIVLEWKKGGCA